MQVVSRAEVIDIKTYDENLKEFTLKPKKYRKYKAGRFLQLTLDDVTASDIWPESRTFSMASAYNKKNKTIKLIIRKIGKYTEKIFNTLEIGSNCTIKYSFGDMILPKNDQENKVVLVAGGTGIAPFLSFIEELEVDGGLEKVKLIYSVRKEEDLIGYEYIKSVLKPEQIKLFITDVESKLGQFRLMNVNDIFENVSDHYYICGAPSFIKHFKEELSKKSVSNIHIDEWE